MSLGETTYHCRNYHKDEKGKYLSVGEKGTTRILYVPLDVQIHLHLVDGDRVRFVVNAYGDVVIRKV